MTSERRISTGAMSTVQSIDAHEETIETRVRRKMKPFYVYDALTRPGGLVYDSKHVCLTREISTAAWRTSPVDLASTPLSAPSTMVADNASPSQTTH